MSFDIRTAVTLLGIAALCAGCSSVKVTSNHDPAADFAKYSTFSWIEKESKDGTRFPAHLDLRLRRVTEDVLGDKGFTRARTPPETDLLLTYYVGLSSELRVSYTPYGAYSTWGYRHWGGPAYADVYRYNEGTLVLDVVDARTHQLVWTGQLVSAVKSENPPGDRVEWVMQQLLKEFPPK